MDGHRDEGFLLDVHPLLDEKNKYNIAEVLFAHPRLRDVGRGRR